MGDHKFRDDYGQLREDYDNVKVQQIRQELGAFDYKANPITLATDHPLEEREMTTLENHAKY